MGDTVEAHLRSRHQHGVYTLWIGYGDKDSDGPTADTIGALVL